ncbi:MAG: hypothetical protein DYG99_03915 [Bacteroidetes bacterium CHB5]|nr:hypothetical protein [Bacteroidetes bacterium CHB5]
MKKFISILKTGAINLAIFLVLLIVVNWGCGLYMSGLGGEKRNELPNYADDRQLAKDIFHDYHQVSHRYKPFTEWQMLPYAGKTLTIDETGYRVHQPPAKTEAGPVVRFFGGSTMWGEGADDAHTIPALFHSKFKKGTVANHGQLAYNSRQGLETLITLYAQGKQTDVAVFYDGVNDAAFLCPTEINELPGHRLVPMFQNKIYGGKKQVALTILNNLFTENVLLVIRHLKNVNNQNKGLYNCADAEKGKEVARMLVETWEMANALVTSRGGKFIAVLQPASYLGKPRLDHLELNEELGVNFRFVYNEVKRLMAERNHTWFVDMTDAFDGDQYIYIDFCHVTAAGNEIIADRVNKILEP